MGGDWTSRVLDPDGQTLVGNFLGGAVRLVYPKSVRANISWLVNLPPPNVPPPEISA